MRRNPTDLEFYRRRILGNVITAEGGCWEWQGALSTSGYGRIWLTKADGTRKAAQVHRVMMQALGHDAEGLVVCHRCDNPRCCNPDHLFIGTAADNIHDCMSKGRKTPPPLGNSLARVKRGDHHWQKLTIDQVRAIRARLANGERLVPIAADFGVSFKTISKIKRGQRWTTALA